MNSVSWSIKMALREGRKQRTSLFALFFTVLLTVCLVSSLLTFSKVVLSSIELQDKSLLGGDFVIKSTRALDKESKKFLETIPGLTAEMIQTNSMVRVGGELKLAQIRGISSEFPIYGEIVTEPPFKHSGAFVEESFAGQTEVQIGKVTVPVSGVLRQVPGEVGGFGFVAPRIYLPKEVLVESGLLDFGSQARFRFYFRGDAKSAREKFLPALRKLQLEFESAEDKEASIAKVSKSVSSYIELGGFFIFILGLVGIGLSFQSFVVSRKVSFEILKAIGATKQQAISVFLCLGASVSLLASLVGAILSNVITPGLVALFKPFLPIDKLLLPSPLFSIGLALSLTLWVIYALSGVLFLSKKTLFALIPSFFHSALLLLLISIVSPKPTLPIIGLGALVILSAIILVLSALSAKILEFMVQGTSYSIRFGVLQVTRRLKEHFLFIVSVALALFLMLSSTYFGHSITKEIAQLISGDRPNIFLFDIQEDQLAQTENLLNQESVTRSGLVPVITMRLAKINGIDTKELYSSNRAQWVLRREYRTTYRDQLLSSESVIQGQWQSSVTDQKGEVPISVERSMAKELEVTLGDKLSFDVQGINIDTKVASIREVNWKKGDINFFVIFPPGILEDAPKYYAMLAKVNSDAQLKLLQERVNKVFANISVMDLRVIFAGVQRLVDSLLKITLIFSITMLVLSLAICGATLTGTIVRRIEDERLISIIGADIAFRKRARLVEFLTLATIGAISAGLLFIAGSMPLINYLLERS